VRQAVAKRSFLEAVRFFTVTAIAAADARVAAYHSKYVFSTWRPVSAIPLGNGVGFPADATWRTAIPMPSHPEYPSGTPSTGTAYAEALWLLTRKDKATFTLTSYTVPGDTRTYKSYSDAAIEQSVSRVYGGIHYRFSVAASAPLGTGVARVAYQYIYGSQAKLASGSASAKNFVKYETALP
jgi:hypothetical protein